jgi:hypothetical protein
VIVRILGEGQWELSDEDVADLNAHDAVIETAIETGDEETFRSGLTALVEAVRSRGTAVPDDSLSESDLILPPADATLEEVRELLSDEGLIPG